MGTAHGAEELGLWPHGHACQAGALGRYIAGSSVTGRRKWFVRLRVRPAFSKFTSILNYTVY
jgi:hypothetical protein